MKKKAGSIPISLSDRLRLNFTVFSFRFLNFLLRALRFLVYRPVKDPGRILIFRTGSLGDSICAIPAISGIRKKYPRATIDILTNPGSAKSTLVSIEQLLAPTEYDNVINYFGMGLKQLASTLRKHRYDLIVQLPQANALFHHLVRDTLFFRLIAPSGWGWEMGKILMYRKIQEKWIEYDTEVIRISNIARRNGVPVDTTDFPLNITPADEQFVDHTFEQLGIGQGRILGIAIGAKRPQNRWPLRYVRKVVEMFSMRHHIVILGGAEDRDMAAELCINDHVHNLCGSLTPMQSAVAMKRCSVFLSNDTGPMHLSYAVGTPTVATFTSRDFIGTWFPPEDGRNVVFRSDNIPCSICLSEFCANNICIQGISPLQVTGALAPFLQSTPLN